MSLEFCTMRQRLMKVYFILIGFGLILFTLWLKNHAFMGKTQRLLSEVDAEIDAAARPGIQSPTKNPPEPAPQDTSTTAAVTAPTPQPTIPPESDAPAKGGMGDKLKQIIENRKEQNQRLQKSFEGN
jgi:hypothetical protein